VGRFLSEVRVAEDPERNGEQALDSRRNEGREGVSVAVLCLSHQLGVHATLAGQPHLGCSTS
jgi:hypothetical protein